MRIYALIHLRKLTPFGLKLLLKTNIIQHNLDHNLKKITKPFQIIFRKGFTLYKKWDYIPAIALISSIIRNAKASAFS